MYCDKVYILLFDDIIRAIQTSVLCMSYIILVFTAVSVSLQVKKPVHFTSRQCSTSRLHLMSVLYQYTSPQVSALPVKFQWHSTIDQIFLHCHYFYYRNKSSWSYFTLGFIQYGVLQNVSNYRMIWMYTFAYPHRWSSTWSLEWLAWHLL